MEHSETLQSGMPMEIDEKQMNTGHSGESVRDFLTSIFEYEEESNVKMIRYAEAIIEIENLELNSSSQTLTSTITEIITNFLLHSQDDSRKKEPTAFLPQLGIPELCSSSVSREEDAIDFLLATFMRCHRELGSKFIDDNSRKVLDATERAVLHIFVLMQSGYFMDQLRSSQANLIFLKRLLEDTISIGFLNAVVEYAENPVGHENDVLSAVFNPMFDLLRQAMMIQHLEENKDDVVHQIMRVLSLFLSIRRPIGRPLCKLLVSRRDFLPDSQDSYLGREFPLRSYLGPFFNYGLISQDRRPNTRVFVNSEEDAHSFDGMLNLEMKQYCARMDTIRGLLHQIVLPLLMDQSSRKASIKWISTVVSTNWSRSRTHIEPSAIIGDNFMTNFLAVLYKLSEKIDLTKISVVYPFQPGSLVDVSKETRINMDELRAAEFASQFGDKPAEAENFSTSCFFFTIAAQHLVYPPLISSMTDFSRHIKQLKKKIGALKEKLNTASAQEKSQLEEELRLEEEHWKLTARHFLCLRTHAHDPYLMASALDFVDKQLKLMMSALSPELDLLGEDTQLPEKATPLFSAYPQHYLEDIFDFYIFGLLYANNALMERNTDWISRLTILFTHYDYMKSPFLVAKLVRVLTGLPGFLWYGVVRLRMTQERLLVCMIKFYSDFEDNGDFYEKFNVRGNIQYMLEKMGEDVFYKSRFMEMARDCGSEFIRFVNMVINDATWCIDESLSGLKSIHDVEKKMASKFTWDAMTPEVQNQELGVYEEAKRKVKGWLGTAKSNLKMLLSITDNSPEPFRTAALGERLAAMLNHNLSQLMGSKCAELKVANPSSYGWQPREFVTLLISIYLGLNVPAFVKYIAYDERTYNPAFFESAIERMKKNQILSFSHLERFQHLADDVRKEYEAKAELEEEYDDVPDSFKDPIMDAIMVDPVRLPSGHIMDRAVIERHLLSTPNNPFNRAPLSQGELVPDVQLKQKIQDWIAQKRKSKH